MTPSEVVADACTEVEAEADAITLYPGAKALLRRLACQGVVLGVVSANSAPNVRRVLGPEVAALSSTPLGTPNLGGPIVTAGGVAFIGATFDHVLRAFDVSTGRQLWKGQLPGGARATPMTYAVNGRQYVVIALGGSEDWGKSDALVAFALER